MADQTQEEKTRRAAELAEQAKLPYKWTQSIRDVDVTIPVAGHLRGKDLDVVLAKERIRVGVKGEEPIIDGTFPHAIVVDESSWTLETTPTPPGKEIAIHLDKVNKMNWWAHVVTSAPAIDITKITPESSSLSDLDGETRQMVEKMMVEQRQKEAGEAAASSEEAKKIEILKKFQEEHPEMDFSKAQMG